MRAAKDVTTPGQYIASLPADRQAVIRQLDALIRKTVPTLKPFIMSGMLGYGPFHYRYASGREGDTAIVGLASQKNHFSLYICACNDKGHISESHRDELPNASVGKGCIRFKRIEDLDLAVIRTILKEAKAAGGMCAV